MEGGDSTEPCRQNLGAGGGGEGGVNAGEHAQRESEHPPSKRALAPDGGGGSPATVGRSYWFHKQHGAEGR